MRRTIGHAWAVLVTAILGGCASVPQGLPPVTDFQADRYLVDL